MEQRLQKLLASAGIGSRRYCETLITAGRVSVNGKLVADLGAKADPDRDEVRVDGRLVSATPEHVYIALNKPLGYVSTVSDPHAKHTVMDLVKGHPGRIYPVGRLDADSAGLLLLTNDGEFTQKLTHPSHQIRKTYRVVARGDVPEWAGTDLRKGVILEDGMTAPAEVEHIDYDEANNATIIDITIHEGRNRQVRRMFDAIGYPVLALTRLRIGPVVLKGLAPGTWRKLHPSEVRELLAAADATPAALPQIPEDRPEDFLPAAGEQPPTSERSQPRERKPDAKVEALSARAKDSEPKRTERAKPAPAPMARKMPKSDAARVAGRKLAAQLSAIPDEDEETVTIPKRREPNKPGRPGERKK
jgi:23S rRNA pseudouridine2605 synthase